MADRSARVKVCRTEVLRRAAARTSLPALLLCLALAMFSTPLGSPMAAGGALVAMLVAGISVVVSRVKDAPSDASGDEASVAVSEDALVVTTSAGARVVPKDRIERAYAVPAEEGGAAAGTVSVRTTDGTELVISLSPGEDAAVLATALVPGERAARFPIAHKARSFVASLRRGFGPQVVFGAWVFAFLGAFLSWALAAGTGQAFVEALRIPAKTVVSSIGGSVVAVLSIAIGLSWLSLVRRREVTVGSDGVVVHGLLKDRYVSYASVRDVKEDDDGVELELRDGSAVHLPLAPGGEGLGARIRAAIARRDGGEAPHAGLESLDRQDRSAEAWRRELAKLNERGEGYREDSLAPERLAAVVEDASLAADRRVGAAWMIAARGDEQAKQRIRIAAGASADEDLKIALERAAEGEIEAEALERAVKKA